MDMRERLREVKRRIALAAKGRRVRLIAVTKQAGIAQVREAVDLGVRAIGENRVKEAVERFRQLPPVEKHLLGHLQSNKARLAVEHFDVIQSLDSLKLAKEIDRWAIGFGKVMQVMIEVNVSGEEQKFGIRPSEAEHFLGQLLKLTHIKVIGLMCMAPWVAPEETRPFFRRLKDINKGLKLPHLSMGMSNDFEVAIEEGSTMVRIGTAIFGKG